VRLWRRPTAARFVDLREEPVEGGELAIDEDGSFTLAVAPSQIATVAISFA
jgi:hypothetical protein